MIEILEEIKDLIFGNKRFADLKHFSMSKSFSFTKKFDITTLPSEMKKMEVFTTKSNIHVRGYLFRQEVSISGTGRIYDVYYKDYNTKVTTVCNYQHSKKDVPYFVIKPKSAFSKLGSIFSSGEWSHVSKEFDASFTVETTHINKMNMLLTIQFAEVCLLLKDYTIEGYNDYLAVYKPYNRIDIIDLDNIYDYGLKLAEVIYTD